MPGRVLRTFDHALPEAWSPGRPQSYEIDLYQSVLGPALPAGTYPLSFGLYDDSWGYRWHLDTGSRDVGRREYQGATVVAPGGSGAAPRCEFSGGWGLGALVVPGEPCLEAGFPTKRSKRQCGENETVTWRIVQQAKAFGLSITASGRIAGSFRKPYAQTAPAASSRTADPEQPGERATPHQ